MAENKTCHECGSSLPENAPEELCPRCLMRVAMGESHAGVTLDNPGKIEGPGTTIGRYELLDLIGEGGMGLVYLAEQKEPVRRKVALKIIKPGMDSRQVIARFEAERQTLAVLDHPNIAHVFDAGCTETGRPYFVMEHVKGTSITRYCDENKLTIEQRLRLFEQVCEAVHHAHQKGIIHRDLKPSNILVSVHGDRAIPKIIDFGIAKAIAEPMTERTGLTEQGQLLGTPEYMSPEQVDLAYADIDTRSDVYSLGVVLYELLAGVAPFAGNGLRDGGIEQIRQIIRDEEPKKPSAVLTGLGEKAQEVAAMRRTQILALARRLKSELEWIPLKAMRKEPEQRYQSVSEMAQDVSNYLHGNALLAGPETAAYRTRKFVRKHAGSVTSAALVAVVIVLGFITSTVFSFRAEKARGEEAAARTEAEQARDKEAALRAQVEQALVRTEKAEAIAAERNEEYRRTLYVNRIQLADAKYREGNVANARKLLESCPNDLRGWEWNRLNHVLDHSAASFATHQGQVTAMDLSPDGKRAVTGAWNGTIKVWDMTTGREVATLPAAHTGWIYHVDFSPDGKHFVSCDGPGTVKVWDTADANEPVTSIRPGGGWIPCVSFSPDGSRVVSATQNDGSIKVWDVVSGDELLAFGRRQWGVLSVAFSPDGKQVISADEDGTITVWDSASGDEVRSLAGHGQAISTMSINSDGSLFATGGSLFATGSDNKTITIWDATTGSLVMTLRGHDGPINSVAFSPNDKYLISTSYDCTVRIWDTATGEQMRILRGHENLTIAAVFTSDGKRAVSGSWDGTIKVWDVSVDHEINRLPAQGQVTSIAFSPDGKRLVSRDHGGKVKVWDLIHCCEIMTCGEGQGGGQDRVYRDSVSFSPDGKRIASVTKAKTVVIRDVETGREITTLGTREDNVRCLAFSPDGQRIVSGSFDGNLKLWDVEHGTESKVFHTGNSGITSVAFSPDGHRIISGCYDGQIKVWDASSGAELMSLIGHGKVINGVTFSPDGQRIASSCQNDDSAKIWDAATGKELKTLRGHRDMFASIAFSPDGRRLVTASRDGTAKVWDSTTGEELLTLHADSGVADVAFSPDGKSIAGCTWGKTIVLWDSAAPADGYGPRKTATTARILVRELHERHPFYRDVIKTLEADTELDDSVRQVALQIAHSRRWEDACQIVDELYEKHGLYHRALAELQEDRDLDEPVRRMALEVANDRLWRDAEKFRRDTAKLWQEAFKVVQLPGEDIEVYRAALVKAQQAHGWDPNNWQILGVLGMAQYRAGLYEEALGACRKAAELRVNKTGETPGEPFTSAFLAMALHQVGRADEAKSTLEKLGALLKDERFARSETAKALLAEAEGVIGGGED